ncbi:alpha/beta fold hydrolase [Brachybacterium sp. UMB0905]|uniref:alpha/beta fold hydrolase n=1 Tax=Brachybacterium sp. UMB0905 TaxID=2069310 RepID=UPI0011AF6438|nr:hypothetical protein [Brachybacterium sp. UMB0905]
MGTIAFRELNYAPEPDGLPFDPGVAFAELAERFPAFAGEPYDLAAAAQQAPMPLIALSGERDLRTPRTIAEWIVSLAPRGHLLELPSSGHSLLDVKQKVAREVLGAASLGGADAVLTRADEISALAAASTGNGPGIYVRAVMRLSELMPHRLSGLMPHRHR